MIKILYFGLSLLFSFSFAHATIWNNLQSLNSNTCTAPKNEWRIGVGVGVEYINFEAKVKDNFTAFGALQFGDRDQTQKHVQFSPSFEIGKTNFDDYYLGILTSWHYSGAEKKSRAPSKNTTYFKHDFKLHYYVNIMAKLGYKLTSKTLFYTLVGPSIAKWSHKTEQFHYNFAINQEIKDDLFKISQTGVGLGVGFGLEHIICKGLALSVDYTHQFYKGKRGRKTMSFLDNDGEEDWVRSGIVSKKIKPSFHAIVLRLAYFF